MKKINIQILLTATGIVQFIQFYNKQNLEWIQHHMAPEAFPMEFEFPWGYVIGALLILGGFLLTLMEDEDNTPNK